MTLTEFLLARIAEDEAAARAAVMEGHEWGGERWMLDNGYQTERVVIDNGSRYGGATVVYDEGSPSLEQAAHIARHDPARVLAECEAKRRIAELHRNAWDFEGGGGWPTECGACGVAGEIGDAVEWPCDTLRALALPYVDHPDYRGEWRP